MSHLVDVNTTGVTLFAIVSHASSVESTTSTTVRVAGARENQSPSGDPTSALTGGDATQLIDPILTAARNVLMARGPRRATLTEVARVAKVSRMTVYRRFESLDRLQSEVLTVELAQVLAAGAANAASGTACERAATIITDTTRTAASNPVLRRILTVDPEALTPLMVSRFGRTQRAAADLLEPLLTAGMSSHGGDGSIRETDPSVLAQSVVLCAQGWVFAAGAIDGQTHGDIMWRQWHGLAKGMLRPDEKDADA